jgi:LAGLIDADG-like domain
MRIRSDQILRAKDGTNRGRPSRLTQEQVRDIVSSHSTRESKELAAQYGCTYGYICRIWREHGLPKKSHRRYSLNENYFESIDTPDKAYFLGLIAADGSVAKTMRGPMALLLKLSVGNEAILQEFLKRIGSDASIKHTNYVTAQNKEPRIAAYVCITSEKICADLARYNVIPRKTWSYISVLLSAEMMPRFLRGYFDGDGTIIKVRREKPRTSDYRFHIVTYRREAAVFFQNYLHSQGVRAAIQQDGSKKDYAPLYQVRMVSNESKEQFVKLIYAGAGTLCLARKLERAREYLDCLAEYRGKYAK